MRRPLPASSSLMHDDPLPDHGHDFLASLGAERGYARNTLAAYRRDLVQYQATIDEPNVYTRPFTISVAYRRNMEGREVVEEPCYETNEALMEVYRFSGFSIFPGMTPEEARSAGETTQ